MTIDIVPFTPRHRARTVRLIDRVFPSQSPVERLSMRIFRGPFHGLLRLAGIGKADFWVATQGEDVVGTVGLYETGDGAAWLGWFCVAPEARGHRLGQRLLDFAIAKARETGHDTLRLYTSTDPNEAAAQALYERNGLGIETRERPLLWRLAGSPVEKLIRARRLTPA